MIEVPLTDAQFAAAAQRLRGYGIELNGPSGTITKQGFTARYQHADGKLTIEILDKPFFITEGMIESRLKGYIEQNSAA